VGTGEQVFDALTVSVGMISNLAVVLEYLKITRVRRNKIEATNDDLQT